MKAFCDVVCICSQTTPKAALQACSGTLPWLTGGSASPASLASHNSSSVFTVLRHASYTMSFRNAFWWTGGTPKGRMRETGVCPWFCSILLKAVGCASTGTEQKEFAVTLRVQIVSPLQKCLTVNLLLLRVYRLKGCSEGLISHLLSGLALGLGLPLQWDKKTDKVPGYGSS